MPLYNTGSFAVDIHGIISVPTSISGANLTKLINRNISLVEQKLRLGAGGIGSVDIAEQYQGAIFNFSACEVLRATNQLLNGTTNKVKMGDFSKDAGGANNAVTGSADFYCEQGMAAIRELKGRYSFKKANG